MHAPRIALPTAACQLPIRQAIDAVGSSGASGVMFDLRDEVKQQELGETGRRQLLHYLQERNLKLGACTFTLRRALIDPELLDARIEAVKQAMSFAWELGSRVLTLRLGQLPATDDAAAQDQLRFILRDLAGHANRVGVVPTLMTSADAKALSSLLNEIKEGPLGVEVDPAALVLARRSPTDWMRELHASIEHIQIRDALRDVGGLGKEVAVGRGEVDWDEVAALLQEMDYRGWLTVIRNTGDDPLTDMTRGITYLKNLLLM